MSPPIFSHLTGSIELGGGRIPFGLLWPTCSLFSLHFAGSGRAVPLFPVRRRAVNDRPRGKTDLSAGGRVFALTVGVVKMTPADSVSEYDQRTSEGGQVDFYGVVRDAEDRVLHQDSQGRGLAQAMDPLYGPEESRIALPHLIAHRHDQSSPGNRRVMTGSPSSPGPATILSCVSTASMLLPSRGTRYSP